MHFLQHLPIMQMGFVYNGNGLHMKAGKDFVEGEIILLLMFPLHITIFFVSTPISKTHPAQSWFYIYSVLAQPGVHLEEVGVKLRFVHKLSKPGTAHFQFPPGL